MPSEFLKTMRALLSLAETYEVDIEAERGSGRSLEMMEADGLLAREIKEARAALDQAEQANGPGFLEVGADAEGMVVVNLPRDMTGHLKFSPAEADQLADTLIRKASEARGEVRVIESILTLLPPPKDCCQVCGAKHEPAAPHNAQSIYYGMRFKAEHGRDVTWADAIAHASAETQDHWKTSLTRMGHWSEPPAGVATIAEPCK